MEDFYIEFLKLLNQSRRNNVILMDKIIAELEKGRMLAKIWIIS